MIIKLLADIKMWILGSYVERLMDGSYMAGMRHGYELGVRVGRMQVGDKGIIFSNRARQEIEKILEV